MRLPRMRLGDLDIESEGVLGHLLGQDAGFRAQSADVTIHGSVNVGRRDDRVHGAEVVGLRLRGTGGGLRRGSSGADAGLGCENVGVGQREREDGLALRGAA